MVEMRMPWSKDTKKIEYFAVTDLVLTLALIAVDGGLAAVKFLQLCSSELWGLVMASVCIVIIYILCTFMYFFKLDVWTQIEVEWYG